MPDQPGLNSRHRDEDGEIHKKRSDTLIKTLRKEYREDAFGNVRSDMKLSNFLKRAGVDTLSDYLKHRR
ncbi:MAG TPA: hypothetical protein VGG22_15130 [Candidatus Baltobacteraceae bacterium]|jgi:hypothetical protein